MSEIAFGTAEHIAGLSREALEADFRYVQDRRTELEEACERLQDENERLHSCMSDSAENAKQIMHEAHVQAEENAKLREQGERLFDKTLELATENAKLRELVRDIWSVYHDGATNKEFRALPDRMRELGVEV